MVRERSDPIGCRGCHWGWKKRPKTSCRYVVDGRQRSAHAHHARRIDRTRLYRDACDLLEGLRYDGRAPLPWPPECPFTLDALLRDKRAALEPRLQNASATPEG